MLTGGIIGTRPRIGGHPAGPQSAPVDSGTTMSQLTAAIVDKRRPSASLRMVRIPPFRIAAGEIRVVPAAVQWAGT
jgi:hypothetical protein